MFHKEFLNFWKHVCVIFRENKEGDLKNLGNMFPSPISRRTTYEVELKANIFQFFVYF